MFNKVVKPNYEFSNEVESFYEVFLRLSKALHSIYMFYSKQKESCNYMSKLCLQIPQHKSKQHPSLLQLLKIEQYLLSMILLNIRSFDNPDQKLLYINENDIFKMNKRKSNQMDVDMEDNEISLKTIQALFATTDQSGKTMLSIKDFEAMQAVNEAQILLFDKTQEFIEFDEIIDFLMYFKLYDLALHVCIKNDKDVMEVIHTMIYEYYEMVKKESDENNVYNDRGYEFEDPEYAWKGDPHYTYDLRAQCEGFKAQLDDTIECLKPMYPNLNSLMDKVDRYEADINNYDDA